MAINAGPDVIEDGLVLCLDAGNNNSYPKSGTTWSDLVGTNNGALTNGPTFDAGNGGGIVFDGTDDKVDVSNLSASMFSAGATVFAFLKLTNATPSSSNRTGIWGFGSGSR